VINFCFRELGSRKSFVAIWNNDMTNFYLVNGILSDDLLQKADRPYRNKAFWGSMLELVCPSFPVPDLKKQKLTQTERLLTLAQIPASDKLDGWECKKARGTQD
jgi:hypothetical protein